ncbi:MAG: hypothetical protein ABJF23_17725 [Bryobacteraceae bacterium]
MKHYQDQDWVDFVRETASLETRAAMQQHLDEGCDACRGLHGTWQRVRDIAGREQAFQPPPGAIRIVKLAYALAHPSQEEETSFSFAQLVFDSLLEPAPAGVRAAGGAARQFLHQAGDIYIDMRWDKRDWLAGQVLDSREPQKHVGEAEVWVTGEGKVCGSTVTNAFGEFQIQCPEDNRHWLVVEIAGMKPIAVRLSPRS